MRVAGPGWIPAVDTARCTGCGWCVGACPLHLLVLEVENWKKSSVLAEPDPCIGCELCAMKCPVGAIEMREGAPAEPA